LTVNLAQIEMVSHLSLENYKREATRYKSKNILLGLMFLTLQPEFIPKKILN